MTISEIVGQGPHYARTCKSLWLFGFFVGMASGGSSGGVADVPHSPVQPLVTIGARIADNEHGKRGERCEHWCGEWYCCCAW